MTPRRLVEDPSAPKELRSLLQGAPAYQPLDRAAFERGRSRLAATAAVSGTFAALFTLKGLGIAVAATAVAVGSGVAIVKRGAPEREPRVVQTTPFRPHGVPSVVKSIVVPPAPVQPPFASAPAVREPAPAATERRATTTNPDALVPELEALNEAKRALKTAPERALTLLDRYRGDFPKGQLRLEALVLRVEALSRLGRHDEARALAKRVEGSSEGGLYSERIKRALGQN